MQQQVSAGANSTSFDNQRLLRGVRTAAINEFGKVLEAGQLHRARLIENAYGLVAGETQPKALKVFETTLAALNMNYADKLRLGFHLKDGDVGKAALGAFKTILKTKDDIGEAKKVSIKYKLGEAEITAAAQEAYEFRMDKKRSGNFENYFAAAEMARDYKLGDEKVRSAARKAYDIKANGFNQETESAAHIAMDFGLDVQLVTDAATSAFERRIGEAKNSNSKYAADYALNAAALAVGFGLGKEKVVLAASCAYEVKVAGRDQSFDDRRAARDIAENTSLGKR
jgi:hypothetical protein